jgi:hypothetical protein
VSNQTRRRDWGGFGKVFNSAIGAMRMVAKNDLLLDCTPVIQYRELMIEAFRSGLHINDLLSKTLVE